PDTRGTWECVPDITAVGSEDFGYRQPCSPPQFFHADVDNPDPFRFGPPVPETQWYDETHDLLVHYLPRTTPPPPDPFGSDPCRENPHHDLEADPSWRERLHAGGDH
ncbi:MAG TPA: hypothetical protein VHM65_08930, partial [Candidatus Lustribacter sp.]|nr:hypothetical protein [Candidatus Lustribacter sp.]